MEYKKKYLKYKLKYLNYKKMGGGSGEPSAFTLNNEMYLQQKNNFETLPEEIQRRYKDKLNIEDTDELIQKIPDLLPIDILKINNPNIEEQKITDINQNLTEFENIYNFVREWAKLSNENYEEFEENIHEQWKEWFESGNYKEDLANFMIIVNIVFNISYTLR